MSRPGQVLVVLAAAVAVWGAGPAAVPGAAGAWVAAAARGAVPAGAVRAASPWGQAIAVPGLRALNRGRDANVSSVSCASPGNCAAGGYYRIDGPPPGYGHRGFVVDERHGQWGQAIRVPGLRALAAGGQSSVGSVSCASAGNCAAGGSYRGHQGFVASENSGQWGRAVKVAGQVSSVSCGSAGNCAAVGQYPDGAGRLQGFVTAEKNGRWGQSMQLPGLGTLNTGGNAGVDSVSCSSAGNCAAGGYYRNHGRQGFVTAEKNGRWGQPIEVPGLGALNTGGNAEVYTVSCASAGNCAAGGSYTDSHGGHQPFVASERNGVWGQAIQVPGLGTLTVQLAYVSSVSCASPGNCAAGGSAYPSGFVVSEKNGVWGQAIEVPGSALAPPGQKAVSISSVSCASAGNCAAGGAWEAIDTPQAQGFAVLERNGVWGQPATVPGLAALNNATDGVDTVSCAPAASCTAGGFYSAHHGAQGFVT